MPKIIENLPQKILDAAGMLFQQHGYPNTDMRQIADHAGIAVGTLYRYYTDKEDLYIHFLANSWKQTRQKLEQISIQEEAPKTRFRKMVVALIADIQTNHKMNQVWREIAKMHLEQPAETARKHKFTGMHTSFAQLFGRAFGDMLEMELNAQDQESLHKLGSFVFIAAVNSCMHPLDTIDIQVNLITELFSAYATHCNQTGVFFKPDSNIRSAASI